MKYALYKAKQYQSMQQYIYIYTRDCVQEGVLLEGFCVGVAIKQSTRIEHWLQDLDRSIWFGPLIIFCINLMLSLRPFRLILCLALCMNMRVPKNHEFIVYEYKSIFTCSLGYIHAWYCIHVSNYLRVKFNLFILQARVQISAQIWYFLGQA